jgi:glycosyltransferase involved in cell wall biosynthesis
MLNKLPIFTTMVGGISGLMKHNYNCIKIPVKNPEGQADVILQALNDTERLQKIANNGLRTVRDVLTKRNPHHKVLIDCINNL